VTANKEYEYRVLAVNEAGPGEASDSSGNIVAKPENGKYSSIECLVLGRV
jgi:hypothetical protein